MQEGPKVGKALVGVRAWKMSKKPGKIAEEGVVSKGSIGSHLEGDMSFMSSAMGNPQGVKE